MNSLLVVEDEAAMRSLLADELEDAGYAVETVPSAAAALELLATQRFAAMITDVNLGGMTGLELTRRLVKQDPDLPVIVLTGFGTLEHAVEAIRAGAYDFLTKPFEPEALLLSVQRAVALRGLRSELLNLRKQVRQQTRGAQASQLDGDSAAVARLEARVRAVAPTLATCLILGESGCGKTRVASHVHELSDRANEPFVAENVAAIPANLLESELFGHVRGAFTGATAARDGLLRRAGRGTLFLDEIGELPREMQPKLLRALDERRFRPVGSDREVDFEGRLLVATNRDLQAEVAAGRFREDLFYRLSVFEISVPPLRERGRDVLELAQRILEEEAAKLHKAVTGFSPEVARALLAYDWPGNVRELHNCIGQGVIMARGANLVPADLPERFSVPAALPPVLSEEPARLETLAEVERRHILRVLHAVDGNKAQAARILGLGRKTLYRKLDSYGVDGALTS